MGPPGQILLTPRENVRRTITCGFADRLFLDTTGDGPSAVFFYDRELDDRSLAESLAAVMDDFVPFTGKVRVEDDDLFIDCGETGVLFAVERSDSSLFEALSTFFEPTAPRLTTRVVRSPETMWDRPALTVQITHFRDGATSIGVWWQHVMGDLRSFLMLMTAWSRHTAGLPHRRPLVVANRARYTRERLAGVSGAAASFRLLSDSDHDDLRVLAERTPREDTAVAILFTPEEIEAIRTTWQPLVDTRLSSSDVVCAHVLSLVAELDPIARSRYLSLIVDLRYRTRLPESVIGNFIGSLDLLCAPDDPAHLVARNIRRGLRRFAEHHSDYHANVSLLEQHGGLGQMERFLPRGIDPMQGNLCVNSWSRGTYDITFGGPAPVFFCTDSLNPLPWFTTLFEGFGGSGKLLVGRLPQDIVKQISTSDGSAYVHRYRPAEARPSALADGLPWVR